MTIFWPSTHPSSRSLCRNASSRFGLSERDVRLRKPSRDTFPACCASAASGAARMVRTRVASAASRANRMGSPCRLRGQGEGDNPARPYQEADGRARPRADRRCPRTLHRQVGHAIEGLRAERPEEGYGPLAHHFIQSGDLAKGLYYALRAGDRAARLFAHDEALRAHERARTCAEGLDLPEQCAVVDESIGDV